MRDTWVRSLGQEDPLEKEMAIHSSTLASKIPWTKEPGRGRKESDKAERLHFHFNDSGGGTSFHVPVGYSHVSFGKISMQVLSPFLH